MIASKDVTVQGSILRAAPSVCLLVALYAYYFLGFSAANDLMSLFFHGGRRPDAFARYVLPICIALPSWLMIRGSARRRGVWPPTDDRI